ncbi:conserved hypothetical protein [Theileria orientalis strain Shintoku]|uniref:Uncharacterized protein n=1 Tax=Theileria orientalis strain Shintoku TaxID=869250 RepID=J4DA20_THEOR|nr:conserved hypothetical protein [Theileria orientalis strain Shintoku]BAM41735.1 conserved hypothetical protein [Theileria orientalis strain Shintoku]|eukprot:XP_009692036.1 conserved hypothetical protein [Theileria orientalis strain Shintoku]
MESSTGYFEYNPLAKRFIQISSMLVAGQMFGKAACENIQDLMDLTWGGNEPCSACGGYGDCRWCDSCGIVLHDGNNCGDFYVNKKGQNLCTLCQNSDHRYKWYVSSNMEREKLAMELWTLRMKNKMDKIYEMLYNLCNRGTNGNQKQEKGIEEDLTSREYDKLYMDEKRMVCTGEEYKIYKRDRNEYYKKQMEASKYCYEALTKYECYT